MKPNNFIYGHSCASPKCNANLYKVLIDLVFAPTNYDSNDYDLNNKYGKEIMIRAVDDIPMYNDLRC